MRFDRSPDSYRARALQAERIAETYASAGDGQWSKIWRQIADTMRTKALALMLAPAPVLPAAEMAVAG